MDNSDSEKMVHKERDQSSDSSDSDSEHGSSGEAVAQVHTPVQVHALVDQERGSPDYMETRDREERSRSSSSSSSSDDEQLQAEVEVEVEVEQTPPEEVNGGDEHNGSRRSSSSSASSKSPSDPCDDPPTSNDVMDELLMAFRQKEVDHSAKTLENVTLNAAADPDQPEITLFVKVRLVQRSELHDLTAFGGGKRNTCVDFQGNRALI